MSIKEILAEENPDAIFFDNLDDAIIGIARRCGQPSVVAYSIEKCLNILSKEMSYEEAIEYFDFNVIGSWIGQNTPVFIHEPEKE